LIDQRQSNLLDSIISQAVDCGACWPLRVTITDRHFRPLASVMIDGPDYSSTDEWLRALSSPGAYWASIEPTRPRPDIRTWIKRIGAYGVEDRLADGARRCTARHRRQRIHTFSSYEQVSK